MLSFFHVSMFLVYCGSVTCAVYTEDVCLFYTELTLSSAQWSPVALHCYMNHCCSLESFKVHIQLHSYFYPLCRVAGIPKGKLNYVWLLLKITLPVDLTLLALRNIYVSIRYKVMCYSIFTQLTTIIKTTICMRCELSKTSSIIFILVFLCRVAVLGWVWRSLLMLGRKT